MYRLVRREARAELFALETENHELRCALKEIATSLETDERILKEYAEFSL